MIKYIKHYALLSEVIVNENFNRKFIKRLISQLGKKNLMLGTLLLYNFHLEKKIEQKDFVISTIADLNKEYQDEAKLWKNKYEVLLREKQQIDVLLPVVIGGKA